MPESNALPIPHGARALVLGFRTALAVWILAFLGRCSPTLVPSPVLAALLAGAFVWGGADAGRLPRGGAGGGALAGFTAALVGLLLFGSVLSGDDPSGLVPSIAIWVPGFLAAGAALGAIGGAVGRAALRPGTYEPDWNAVLARVAAVGTLALLAVGGLVTSRDAGLAVVDWPNSYGYNMFLYPLSKMTGDIFFEHAHRLFGSLVGLTTLVLFLRLAVTERRVGVRGVAAAALVLVVVQGVLGGLRVTGHFTTSTSPDVVRPNLGLAVVHGVVGQLFFALMASLAVFTSPAWKRGASGRGAGAADAVVAAKRGAGDAAGATPAEAAPIAAGGGSSDAVLSLVLAVALFLQLLLGVRVRHLGEGVMLHMTFAVFVVVIAVLVSIRLFVHAGRDPIFRRTGAALLGHTGAQFLLGIAALITASRTGFVAVLFPTLHQTTGALLLANAVVAHLWCRRLLAPAAPAAVDTPPAAPAPASSTPAPATPASSSRSAPS